MLIDIWDHFNADMNTVVVESSGNFPTQSVAATVGGGDGYSTYQIEITDATPSPDAIELFISVESDVLGYGSSLPGKPVTSYFTYSIDVSSESPAPEFHEHWAGVGYNHANIAQNPNEQNLDLLNLTQVWANITNGSPGFKPAGIAIADGKVFYTSQTGGAYYWPKSNMTVHCLDLTSGAQIWSALINQSSDNSGRFQTSPFWYEDKVYVGGDKLHCYNDETGALIWEYDATPTSNLCAYPNHSPKVFDGKVYCTSRASLFVCLDADDGSEIWTYNVALSEMMPATDGERVYYPSNTTLYCNDCTTGTLLWSSPITLSAGAWSGPAIWGDRIYQNGWTGYVNCYDKLNGDVKWVYDLPGTGYALNAGPAPYTDPADDKTVVAFGSAYYNHGIWGTKDNGDSTYTPLWNLNLSNEFYDCSGLTYGDYFIIPDKHKGQLIFIHKINGTVEDIFAIIPPEQISAQPAIAYDHLVVATFNAVRCYTTP